MYKRQDAHHVPFVGDGIGILGMITERNPVASVIQRQPNREIPVLDVYKRQEKTPASLPVTKIGASVGTVRQPLMQMILDAGHVFFVSQDGLGLVPGE